MKNLLKFVILNLFLSLSSLAQVKVWIDYDVAVGKIIRDVDDGYALYHALESESLDIKGISTVFGNIKSSKKMVKITKNILRLHNRESIKVYQGANSVKDLGKKNDAISALILALEKEPLTILAMGRLTNIATLAMLRPDLIKNIEELIVMGGRQPGYNTPIGDKEVVFWDANIDGDFDSVRLLIDKKVKIRMIPVESMKNSIIAKEHLKLLLNSYYRHRWLAKRSRVWRLIWKFFPKMDGFIPWDLFLVSYLTHKKDFSCLENIPVGLVRLKNDTTFNKSGENGEYKYFLTASHLIDSENLGSYCYAIKPGHVMRVLKSWTRKP